MVNFFFLLGKVERIENLNMSTVTENSFVNVIKKKKRKDIS